MIMQAKLNQVKAKLSEIQEAYKDDAISWSKRNKRFRRRKVKMKLRDSENWKDKC